MKVLMITSSYPLFPGDGTAPFIEEIARGVVARGHTVDIVLPAHPRLSRPAEPGLRFFPFAYAPHKALNVWGYAQSLKADRGFKGGTLLVAPFAALATRLSVARRLRAESYDVVHAHWVVPGGILSYAVARAARRPFVISLHGSDVFAAERNALVGRLAARAFASAGAVTACSSDLRSRAICLGSREERTATVPYGVDAAFFRAPGPAFDREAMRRRLGVGQGQTLVVAVGRLVEKKGFAHLVEAAGGLARIHVALIGDGDLARDLARDGAAHGASLTLAGRFSRDDIRNALHAADILAVPSVIDSKGNVDGLPNALLESMAAGGAIVASRVAGIPDVMTDGVEGVLVEPGSASALRSALVSLADDAARRQVLGRAAAEKVSRDLTWDRVAATLEESYVRATALAQR